MTLEVGTRAPARPKSALVRSRVGIAGAVISAVVTTLANVQLARAARRYKSRGSPPLPSFLRRDVGLLPEVPTEKSHWDYR